MVEAGFGENDGPQAPIPMRPRHLEALFTPGRRFAYDAENVGVVIDPEVAGALRLPTGQVLAGDPNIIGDGDLPFTVTVPPGDYPVVVAAMRWEATSETEVLAAMLQIRDRPAAAWELAVRSGEDVSLLGADGFYGFEVTTGLACFMDASGRGVLPRRFEADEKVCGLWESYFPSHIEVSDPETGTNVIGYLSGMGDGTYPVWIGRDAGGEVVCFVADMLVLHNAVAR
jgi:hypothetical protein